MHSLNKPLFIKGGQCPARRRISVVDVYDPRIMRVSKKQGLYSFWRGSRCLYVGMTFASGLRKRLMQHVDSCHNERLASWIDARPPHLYIQFMETCARTKKDLERHESKLIQILNPELNKKK